MQHYLFSLPQAQHIKNKNSCSTPQAKRCAKNLNPKLFNIRRCYRVSLFFKAPGWSFFKHFGFSTLFFLSPFLRSKKQRAKVLSDECLKSPIPFIVSGCPITDLMYKKPRHPPAQPTTSPTTTPKYTKAFARSL